MSFFSFFNRTVLDRCTTKMDTVLSYCHYTLNDSSLVDYLSYFQDKGIGLINASPISMGLLSDRGPPSWHPATNDIKKASASAAAYCKVGAYLYHCFKSSIAFPYYTCKNTSTFCTFFFSTDQWFQPVFSNSASL